MSIICGGTVSAASTTSYTATDTDTLWNISQKYGGTLAALLNANPQVSPKIFTKAWLYIFLPDCQRCGNNGNNGKILPSPCYKDHIR